MKEIKLGSSVKTVRGQAIICENLTALWLPRSVEKLAGYAVRGTPFVMFYNPVLADKIEKIVYLGGNIEDLPVKRRSDAIQGFLYAEKNGMEEIKPWRDGYKTYLKRNAKTYLKQVPNDETLLRLTMECIAIPEKEIDGLIETLEKEKKPELIAALLEYKQKHFGGKQRDPFSMSDEDAKIRRMEKLAERQEAIKGQVGIKGISFVATGFFHNFGEYDEYTNAKDLSDLKSFIEARGGYLRSGVSSKTDYLISNDPNSDSPKMKKAKELGVLIITEEEFLKMANESE